MKQYEITVDGHVYQVSLKEISPQAVQERSTLDQPPAAASVGAGREIPAPMAGNILSVAVNVGAEVKAGDTLVILEAMKMENEIVSPSDGVVSQLLVSAGQTVDSGQLLVII